MPKPQTTIRLHQIIRLLCAFIMGWALSIAYHRHTPKIEIPTECTNCGIELKDGQ